MIKQGRKQDDKFFKFTVKELNNDV